jgi:hypothetical protein
VNKLDETSIEYNDTKSILEKFVFLTDKYYNELRIKRNQELEEKQKKRQLQKIFKGF